MLAKRVVFWLWLGFLAVPGCGGTKPVTGGTAGVLHSGSQRLSEIQVTIHQSEGPSTKPIGFGVPGADGAFRLMSNGAAGPLHLTPGNYRCTLESIGAPIQIPQEYARADTTPLKFTWSDGDRQLDLDIPTLQAIR